MSDITITQANLSRFNKRLQKSLSSHFKQDIPLHTAADMLAQAVGVKNDFELKQKLNSINNAEKNQSDGVDLSLKIHWSQAYKGAAKQLLEELTQYFKTHETQLKSLHISSFEGCPFISILGKSKKYDDEGFGIYFNDKNPLNTLDKEIKIIHFLPSDYEFLKNICEKYFTDDRDENAFLGFQVKKQLGIKDNESYKIYQKISSTREIVNFGFVTEKFMVVPSDYLQKNECPYILNQEKWCEITNADYPIYDSFQNALQNRKGNNLILQCCTLVNNTGNRKNSIFSYFLYTEDDRLFFKGVSEDTLPFPYNKPEDFISFQGYLAKEQMFLNAHSNPYSVNEQEFQFWLDGFNGDNKEFKKLYAPVHPQYPRRLNIEYFGDAYELFLVAPDNFIENKGLPFALHNEHWTHIEKNGYEYYQSFEEALSKRSPNEMILQFCVGAGNFISEGKSICSYYAYEENNSIVLEAVSHAVAKTVYHSVADLDVFINQLKQYTEENLNQNSLSKQKKSRK